MSYIDENGVPVVIKNSEGKESTPSVIWFDGKVAYVGEKANARKIMANSPIYECVKRDIGKDTVHRYTVNGINYGAYGLSAIILKKFKLEVYNFFKKKNWLSQEENINDLQIPAVITVPAYFGEKQRLETRIAGIAAGFDVLAIINEPTAAALTYGIQLNGSQKILVFDLGGGTFDVTIIEMKDGEAKVLASDGADELGGKDWDEILLNYILYDFEQKTKKEIPDDDIWEVKKVATQSKYALSETESVNTNVNGGGDCIETILYRERTTTEDEDLGLLDLDDDKFYFEERSENLLTNCKAILSNTLETAGITWNDLDEIVLAGGSCRMPMIPKMIEKLSGRSIRKNIPGFSYDTAISQGAALYGRNRNKVIDVTSKSIGIEVKENGRPVIEQLIRKNTPLPIKITQKFKSEANAVLKVFEGESKSPDECVLRGRLELGNPEGEVLVALSIDFNGLLIASVEANGSIATLKLQSEGGDIDVSDLTELIKKVDVRL
ncbi:MAG: Hsp70 family protein [Bacteroidetes bacterium]|nr:Hsp70 family protein [Bacteroidota bacterium]